MKQQVSRTIAKNLVIAATLGLAVVASWAVTDVRNPTIDIGTINDCAAGSTPDIIQRQCKAGAQQG